MFIIIRINFNKEWYRLMTYIKSKSSILKLLASITITLFCIVLFPSAVKAEDNQAAEVNADITLSYNGKTETNGTNGFLHEYVQIPDGTTEMTITFASKESICDMHVYSKGSVPEDVQTWKTP